MNIRRSARRRHRRKPQPPKTHILYAAISGNRGVEVNPDTPAIASAATQRLQTGPARLWRAGWSRPSNPLTARVAVNRMWQEFFGARHWWLPRTISAREATARRIPNFSTGSPRSSCGSGWRREADASADRAIGNLPPGFRNRERIWRLPIPAIFCSPARTRLRLPAELIRDSALSVGGLLNPAIGGKSVFPPQPASVGELAYRNQWKESTGHRPATAADSTSSASAPCRIRS